jgi:hypothetical protein
MRSFLLLAALGSTPLLFPAAPAYAQPSSLPPGDYVRQCTNLFMEGHFLHGTCRGRYGGGESSINVESCSTAIFVDDSGALACIGPGGGAPLANLPPRGYAPPTGWAPWPGYAQSPIYSPAPSYIPQPYYIAPGARLGGPFP